MRNLGFGSDLWTFMPESSLFWLQQGFSIVAPLTFQNQVFFGQRAVWAFEMLSSNPGPSLPSRCQSHPLSCGNQSVSRLYQMLWKAKSPPARKLWPTDRLSIHKIVSWSTIFTQLPTWIYHRDQLHSWQRAPSNTHLGNCWWKVSPCVLKATAVAIECFLLWAVFLHRCWLVQVSHSWQFLLPKLYPIGGWSQSGSLEMELMWGFIVFYLFFTVFINLTYLFGCVMSYITA